MSPGQKKLISRSTLFFLVFAFSSILIYHFIFAQFVPASYSYTVVDAANNTNITTCVDSATNLYELIFLVVSGIIGCALGILFLRVIK